MYPQFTQFQDRVHKWFLECFGEVETNNPQERNWRFLEEAIELYQAHGGTAEGVLTILQDVYNRPPGELLQETGGVLTTLAALSSAAEISLDEAASTEMRRVENPYVIEKIRRKQAGKPHAHEHPDVERYTTWEEFYETLENRNDNADRQK